MTRIIPVALLATARIVAGCGSSSSSTSSTPAAASQPASTGANGAYRQTSAAPAPTSAAIATKHAELGTILAYGPKRLTVYLFMADHPGTSMCSGACAAAWPPVLGTPRASGGAVAADLGTIRRPDGQMQVSYRGHPLYLFVRDQGPGDTSGGGVKAFGAEWYVLAPSGRKIDRS